MSMNSQSELCNVDEVIDLVSSDEEQQNHGSSNIGQHIWPSKKASTNSQLSLTSSAPLNNQGKRRRQDATIAYKSSGPLYNKNHRTTTLSSEGSNDPAKDDDDLRASPQIEDQQEQIQVSGSACFLDENETEATRAPASLEIEDPCSFLAQRLPSQPVISLTFIDSSSDGDNDDGVITEGILSLVDQLQLPHSVSCSGYRPRKHQKNHDDAEQTSTSIETLQCLPITQHKQQNLYSVLKHIQQTDKWSCGFRNLQMLLSALLPHLPPHHPYFHGDIPSSLRRVDSNPECIVTPIPCLRQLQSFLEQSWADGFDKQGAKHYNRRIVGRKSEIGAVEVSSCLAYLNIDSVVLQFIKCKESRSLLGEFCWAYFSKRRTMSSSLATTAGMNSSTTNRHPEGVNCSTTGYCCFCCNTSQKYTLESTYAHASDLLEVAESTSSFGGSKIISTRKTTTTYCTCSCPSLPLYLQWEGHSITIVGVEKLEKSGGVDDITLLVFDPMANGPKLKNDLQRAHARGKKAKGISNNGSQAPATGVTSVGKLPSSMRLSSNKLLAKDCQILMCSLRPLNSREKNLSRDRVNAVTAAKAAVVRSLRR